MSCLSVIFSRRQKWKELQFSCKWIQKHHLWKTTTKIIILDQSGRLAFIATHLQLVQKSGSTELVSIIGVAKGKKKKAKRILEIDYWGEL